MYLLKKNLFFVAVLLALFMPDVAFANIVDNLNIAPFVPIVLNSMMMIATRGYDFFVGNGDGIIYLLIWGFLGLTTVLYVVKMYFPKTWLGFLGFSGGGELYEGKITGWQIAENLLRPAMRAAIAVILLLQIRPMFLTHWLVNPFLELGSIYTTAITNTINDSGTAPKIECPSDILSQGWLSQESCVFLTQPVSDLSHANNQIIKRGFDYLTSGIRGLFSPIPAGGQNFMNVITGVLLIFTFVSCNLFMALLIIQGIFNFGMQLILYPFSVLTYVVKSSDKWLDIWPAFGGITKALQDLIITMISCSFMLCVDLAIVRALFHMNKSIYVVAADGSAYTNMPQAADTAMGFGEHSVTWLSAILTFYLFFKLFDMTQNQLKSYVGSGMDGLYNTVKSDSKRMFEKAKSIKDTFQSVKKWIKK